MIKKITNINKCAVFDGFEWDKHVIDSKNQVAEFKKLNIIYGRNYSGKTTLSRILRSFENKELFDKFEDAQFELLHSGTERMTHDNLDSHLYNIRVYNKDFVKENLGMLYDEDDSIKPFAVLGEKNVEIEKQINGKEAILGSAEEKTGIRHDFYLEDQQLIQKRNVLHRSNDDLQEKLKTKARNIKNNRAYHYVNYNVTKINADIQTIRNDQTVSLTDEEIKQKQELLKEQPKEPIQKFIPQDLEFEKSYQKVKSLLTKPLKPTKPIQELLENAVLQKWVQEGIGLHKGKRKVCAFCSNNIPLDLWDKLDAHFSSESKVLQKQIQDCCLNLSHEMDRIGVLLPQKKEDFYSIFHEDFESWKKDWDVEIKKYQSTLTTLAESLSKRENDIFNVLSMPECEDNSVEIGRLHEVINKLIAQNNLKTSSLEQDQDKARGDLRFDEIKKFIEIIDYEKKNIEIEDQKIAIDKLQPELDLIRENILKLESEITDLKNELSDEGNAADLVNEILNHWFGHENLKLVPDKNDGLEKGVGFQIMRGDDLAYNLSDGECSLVAFCYFVAKLQDVESTGKELIIWIDDPVSSLDSNHIFFLFSIIHSLIAKPIKNPSGSDTFKYKQLFISTHNLDFLKYLKRLPLPKANLGGMESFIIQRTSRDKSIITIMPDYLKKYITEFNYLFSQIFKCSKAENINDKHESFYNFSNNLRKFLEAYLFYKYPYQAAIEVKLKMFFGDDDSSLALTNRIVNEYSHLECIFDRSIKPLEIPEIPKLARYVLAKIKDEDSGQFNALLKSIGEEPESFDV
ncbi:MAG: AAA family ATPase [Planctomycetes bacterium]|nr:AAA family ATPase [Planctomycetota bacterium]